MSDYSTRRTYCLFLIFLIEGNISLKVPNLTAKQELVFSSKTFNKWKNI